MDEKNNPTTQEPEVPATATNTAADQTATTTPPAAEEQKTAATPAAEPPKNAETKPAPPQETVLAASEPKAATQDGADGKANEATERLKALEAENTALKHGVKPESVGDLLALANTRVSKDVTLEQAIDSVIKQYPQFTGANVGIEVTTAAPTNNDSTAENDEAKARRVMGLPPIK
ncbi:MAG: hypothetical protein ACI4J1_03410 [Ruminiclostridium sp.]